jgi:hypothetical protein
MSVWRQQYNPLRGLTIRKAISLLEEGDRGQYANLEWLYRSIEKREATLRGLKRLRLAALGKLDWSIRTVDDSPAAKAQAETLRVAYDRLDNLKEAVRFLALAEFRGFSHLEKIYEGDNPANPITRLDPVDQWYWVRDSIYAPWRYNATATITSSGRLIDPRHFVIREVEDPINEIGLICYMRKNLSQKDWDAYVETYGIPPIFVSMPPNVPPGKEGEYQAMANAVVGNMRGTLPNGAEVKAMTDGSRSGAPFKEHLNYQDEQLVLAGTSGKLAMLTAPTGLGSDLGEAHQDVFDSLAVAEAGEISELLQAQFDKPILQVNFPGRPVLAYFELAAEDKADVGQVLEHVVQITQAGGQVDWPEISEKTGYTITQGPTPLGQPASPFSFNRDENLADEAWLEELKKETLQRFAAAEQEDWKPLLGRISALAAAKGDDEYVDLLKKLRADLPGLIEKVYRESKSTEILADSLEEASRRGLKPQTRNREKTRNVARKSKGPGRSSRQGQKTRQKRT